MGLLGILGSIFSSVIGKSVVNSVIGAGKSWFQEWREIRHLKEKQTLELKAAKHNATLAKIDRDQRMYADADVAAIEQWQHSYIDELFKGTVLFMFWAPFIPPLSPYALQGALALAAYPLWIQIIMAGTFVSVLGLRYLFLAPLERLFPSFGKNKNKP